MAGSPRITGKTKIAAVIGSPVNHSGSPAMHNAAFAKLGLDWVYVALEVAPEFGNNAVEAMRTLGLGGLNVTMPHKDAVAATADRLTPVAQALQTCNTLYWEDGEIVGHSTDGNGFVNSFNATSPVSLAGQKVAVLGTGGAARSIVEALGRAEVSDIFVAGRDAERATVAAKLAPQARPCEITDLELISTAQVIVNATSVGMAGGNDPQGIPLPEAIIEENQVVADIVYHPRDTPLLVAAEKRGATTITGIGMLAHQAAESFALWTGHEAPIHEMIAQIERPQ